LSGEGVTFALRPMARRATPVHAPRPVPTHRRDTPAPHHAIHPMASTASPDTTIPPARDGQRATVAERLSVAPMMDWTDSHCRVFHRLLAPSARLYSEMVHANAVIHGDRAKLLAMDPVEHPVALQLGGS